MISKINKYKIATILPYKENYSFEKASAASLWVAEFFRNSKFKKYNLSYNLFPTSYEAYQCVLQNTGENDKEENISSDKQQQPTKLLAFRKEQMITTMKTNR